MDANTDEDLSLTEILYALIPALALFLESILANPNQPRSPALDRLARHLNHIRALAALFGVRATTSTAPAPPRARIAAPTPCRNAVTPAPHANPAAKPGPAPAPARTLEL